MKYLEIFFWISVLIVFYTYIGYGIILFILKEIKQRLTKNNKKNTMNNFEPEVTLFVTAFNEIEYIFKKVRNGYNLNYPKDKLKFIWVTDGSDDGTPELLKTFPDITVLHQNERLGKINAMNRGMQFVNTDIVVFSDANTELNEDSIKVIVEEFSNPIVGCISGEKRIYSDNADNAASSGEGLYWKYESTLKKWDSELNTAVGAAGELFAIRKELYQEVEKDTILDDFIISLRITMKKYKIAYTPNAFAMEKSSESINEEMKRKIRIAAGGWQSIFRLKELLNPFKYGLLTFQYVSHRVLRWTITPFLLFILIPINFLLVNEITSYPQQMVYSSILILQIIFYLTAIVGWILKKQKIKVKVLFIPFYFLFMNVSTFMGLYKYIAGKQMATWERSKRRVD